MGGGGGGGGDKQLVLLAFFNAERLYQLDYVPSCRHSECFAYLSFSLGGVLGKHWRKRKKERLGGNVKYCLIA